MPNYNKVILIGYLTADPELKQTPSGKAITNFTIGVTRKYKKDGENVSDFFTIIAWDKVAEIVCKYYRKGTCAIVTGNLQTRRYEVSDGTARHVTEIFAESVDFGESKSASPGKFVPGVSIGDSAPPKFEELTPDDGLPF